ncbi:pimeloyl-ACP methyl ester carboxylesterase [Bradyrhizobium betae]|nr:pimeloyl-ACP methyl ester carboxylesterase [Bradyrhizobium betae]
MTLRALADYPITSALVATAGLMAAGEDDRLIDIDEQSGRLHDEIKHSKMRRVPNAGHMIQQSDTADLMAAVDEAAAETLH